MFRRRVFSRLLPLIFSTLSTGAVSVNAQDQHNTSMHDSAHSGHHGHLGQAVNCTNLASPPWEGLPPYDRSKIKDLEVSLASLSTPAAARAAGFLPALGEIPGMGQHYVSLELSMNNDVDVDKPNNLLFANINGEDQLVGVAYLFMDKVNTDKEIPFESRLAAWHDHPQFAGPGQTLHMLHVWFIESPNGPFAGLNFWLPFKTAGIAIPNPCWMADEEMVDKIRFVSVMFAQFTQGIRGYLSYSSTPSTDESGKSRADIETEQIKRAKDASRQFGSTLDDSEVEKAIMAGIRDESAETLPLLEGLTLIADAPFALENEGLSARFLKFHEIAVQLNAAAKDNNKLAWSDAADSWIENSSEEEKEGVQRTLNELTNNQMSSEERDAAGIEQPTNTGVN